MEEDADVVIIGGGLSGLGCCAELVKHGVGKIIVLEAQTRLGGRVFPSTCGPLLPGVELDFGAEFVHGDGTVIHTYGREEGWVMRQIFIWAHGDGGPLEEAAPDGGAGYYYVGRENKLYRFDQLDDELENLRDELDELGDTELSAEMKGWDLARYLAHRGVSRKALAMAEAGYGNTLGSSMKHLNLELTCRIEKLWNEDGGDVDFRIHPSCRPLLDRFKRECEKQNSAELRTNCKVKAVRDTGCEKRGIRVEFVDPHGQVRTICADQVAVTVPIPILQGRFQDECIQFNPPLPQDKVQALESLCVRGALKIVAKFNKQFWPVDFHGAICADCLVPEFWSKNVGKFMTASNEFLNESEVNNPLDGFNILVGFAMAEFAANLSCFSEKQILDIFLRQLDRIFDPASPQGQGVASQSFEGGFVFDWSKVPYIRSGYSFPSLFEHAQSRSLYARSEYGGKLTFAGEGSDDKKAYMTMHAAIRTGERAASEIMLKRKHSKM